MKKALLKRSLVLLLTLCMLFTYIPFTAFAQGSDEATEGSIYNNQYKQTLVDALEKMNYDPYLVLDSLYEAGMITEDGSPNENLTFDMDGTTVTRSELREIAEDKADDETVVLDGETLTWGEVREAFELDDAVTALNTVAEIEDGEGTVLTDEQKLSMIDLLGQIDAGKLTIRGNRLVYASTSYPSDKKSDGTLDRTLDETSEKYYFTGNYYGEDGYDADYKFYIDNDDNKVWYNTTTTGGSGIDYSVRVTMSVNRSSVKANGTIKVTAKISKAQTGGDVSFNYRVVSGTWTGASVTGADEETGVGTITWKAGDTADKTFTVNVGTDEEQYNGKHTFFIQTYGISNAFFDGDTKCWEKMVTVTSTATFPKLSFETDYIWVPCGAGQQDFVSGPVSNSSYSTSCTFTIPSDVVIPDGDYLFTVNVWGGLWTHDEDIETGGSNEIKISLSNGASASVKQEWTGNPDDFDFDLNTSAMRASSSELKNGTFTATAIQYCGWGTYYSHGTGYLPGVLWTSKGSAYEGVRIKISGADGTNTTKITNISIPDGKFYPGQTVPVKLTFDYPLATDEASDIKVSINGTECTINPAEIGSVTTTYTFLYTVKELDTGSISIANVVFSNSVRGNNYNANLNNCFTLKNGTDIIKIEGNKNSNCSFQTPDKEKSFTDYQIGIDDANPSEQVITVKLPINTEKDSANNYPYVAWIAANTEALTTPITLDIDGQSVTVGFYVKGMYASMDGGKTRYPLYVMTENKTVTLTRAGAEPFQVSEFPIALVTKITPDLNKASEYRKDTVEIFMDPDIASEVNYIEPEGESVVAKTDKGGFTYYVADASSADTIPVAPVICGSGMDVYVKPSIFFSDNYEYTDGEEKKTDGHDVSIGGNADWEEIFSGSKVSDTSYDAKYHETDDDVVTYDRKKVEYYIESNSILQLTYEVHDRNEYATEYYEAKDFSFADKTYCRWMSSNNSIATIDEDGYINFTGEAGDVYFYLNVSNGDNADYQYYLYSDVITVKVGLNPFILIPKNSQEKLVLEGNETNIYFSSNLTARNQAEKGEDFETTFTLRLYEYDDVEFVGGVAVPKDGASYKEWTKVSPYTVVTEETYSDENDLDDMGFPKTKTREVTTKTTAQYVTIPEGELKKIAEGSDKDYVAVISAVSEATGKTLSAYSVLQVKPSPAIARLDKLENYFVLDTEIPDISYHIINMKETGDAYYVIQKSTGELVTGALTNAEEGVIPGSAFGKTTDLKEIYTVSFYARSSKEDQYSVDSLTLYVYNGAALKVLVKAVTRGDIGGTTGGRTTDETDCDEYTIENLTYIKSMLGGESSGALDIEGCHITVGELQRDVNLQVAVSINYGDYAWGMLSDQIKWTSSNNSTATVDYYQGGLYSDVRSYSYVSYMPIVDFLAVGIEEGSTVITASHARVVGLSDSVTINVERLDNQFYLFQFLPRVTVNVQYTNGNGEVKNVTSDSTGGLAIYEPSGIASDIVAISADKDYVGTIYNDNLLTGEQDVAALQVYPCNNCQMRQVSEVSVYVQDENGNPYANKTLTVRAGVYKDNKYCPDAQFRTSLTDFKIPQNGYENITVKTDSNGMFVLKSDSSQFYTTTYEEAFLGTEVITYVVEITPGNGYYPDVVSVACRGDVESLNAKSSIVTKLTRSDSTPYISHSTLYQYYGDTLAEQTYDLTNGTNDIGPSATFSQIVVSTDIVFAQYPVANDGKNNAKVNAKITKGVSLELVDNLGKVPMGQTTSNVITEAITDLALISPTSDVSVYVYPFSSVTLGRNTYVVNRETLGATGKKVIVHEGEGLLEQLVDEYTEIPFEESRTYNLVIKVDGKTVKNKKMGFTIWNLIDQENIDADEGALNELIKRASEAASSDTDIGSVLDTVDLGAFLKLPMKAICAVMYAGNTVMDCTVYPTSHPAHFYILLTPRTIVDNLMESLGFEDSAPQLNISTEKLSSARELLDKQVSEYTESGSMNMGLDGYILCEAVYKSSGWQFETMAGNLFASTGDITLVTADWTIFTPIPFSFSVGVGVGLAIDLSYENRYDATTRQLYMDRLEDITVRFYIYCFGGLGVSLPGIKLRVGPYGKIGINTTIRSLEKGIGPDEYETYHGQRVTLNGEVGIEVAFKLGLIGMTFKIGSTTFTISGWNFNDYDKIEQYWQSSGKSSLSSVSGYSVEGTTSTGNTFAATLYQDGTVLFQTSSLAFEDRNYLETFARQFASETDTLFALTDDTTLAATLQTNAYPYADPLYTEDGKYMLYLTDLDVRSESLVGVAWADIHSSTKINKGTINKYRCMLQKSSPYYSEDGVTYEGAVSDNTEIVIVQYNTATATEADSAIFYFASDEQKTQYKLKDITNTAVGSKIYYEMYSEIEGEWLAANSRTASGLTVSGTDGNYFAAWVSQNQAPQKEMGETATMDDLTNLTNANEIVVAYFDGSEWKQTQLTNDNCNDFNVRVASNGDKAIAIWQKTGSSDNPLVYDVANEMYYSIFDASTKTWSTPAIAYNCVSGSVDAIEAAMLSDGTTCVTFTLDTGDDENGTTDTETLYTIIDKDGTVKTTIRLTNDELADTIPQIKAVVRETAEDDIEQFVIAWLESYEEQGVTKKNARFACVNADGSMDAQFIEKLSASDDFAPDEIFHLAISADHAFENLTLVWTEADTEDETKRYDIKMSKFVTSEGTVTLTTPTVVADMKDNVIVNHFDAYVDTNGVLQTAILGSDYSEVTLTSLGYVDVPKLFGATNSELYTLSSTEPIRNMYLATGEMEEIGYKVSEPEFSINDIRMGQDAAISFTVTNTGTTTLDKVVINLGGNDYTFKNLTIMPGASQTLTVTYNVPDNSDAEHSIKDLAYSVTASAAAEAATLTDGVADGTVVLNRPDIGIDEIVISEEKNAERTFEVTLRNGSYIPLENSGKVAKIAFYKDATCETIIGTEETLSSGIYSLIDQGLYTYTKTISVADLISDDLLVEDEITGDKEIPTDGVKIYAKVWLEDSNGEFDEVNDTNNVEYTTVESLLGKYRDAALTEEQDIIATDLALNDAENKLTVTFQNISLGVRNEANGNRIGNVVIKAYDADGNLIATGETYNSTSKRASFLTFTAEEEKDVTVSLKLEDERTYDEIDHWEYTVYKEKYDVSYSWDNIPTIDPQMPPKVTGTPSQSNIIAVYGETLSNPGTPEQGDRTFLGWYKVLGYRDSDTKKSYYLGDTLENGEILTPSKLATIDFYGQSNLSRIIGDKFDFATETIDTNTVLFALFATVNILYTDNFELSYGTPITTETLIYLQVAGGCFNEDIVGTVINGWFDEGTAASGLIFTATALDDTKTILTVQVTGTPCMVFMDDNKNVISNNITCTCPASANSLNAELTGPGNKMMTLTIAKREITITSADATKVYDKTPLVKLESDMVGKLAKFATSTDRISITYTGTITNAGEQDNTFMVSINNGGKDVTDYYKITYVYGKLTVEKKQINIVWDDADEAGKIEYTYDGEFKQSTVTFVTTDLCEGDDIEITVSGGQTNAGDDYTLTASLAAGVKNNDNYDIANATTPFVIKRQALTIPTLDESQSLTYDGTEQTVSILDFDPTLMKIEGNKEMRASEAHKAIISLRVPANYEWSDGSTDPIEITWKIGKIKLKVIPSASEKIYDGTVLELSNVKVIGQLANGDSYNFSYKEEYIDACELTNLDINFIVNKDGTIDVTDCYDIEYDLTDSSATIIPKELEVVWGDSNLTYNGQEQAPSYELIGVILGDEVNVTLKGETNACAVDEAGEIITPYTATISIDNKNYTLKEGTETKEYTIAQKQILFTWNDKPKNMSYPYDGQEKTIVATANEDGGVVPGDVVTITVSGIEKLPGKHTFVATSDNPNYALKNNTLSYTIENAVLVKPTVGDPVYYNGQNQIIDLDGIDDIFMELVCEEKIDANGAYTATVKIKESMKGLCTWEDKTTGDLTYNWTIRPLDISDAEITLGDELTYNGKEQKQTITEVKVDGFTVTYKVKDDSATDAGTYTMTLTGKGNFTGTITKSFEIAPLDIANAEITLGDYLIYNEQEQTQTISAVKIGDLTVTYTVENNSATEIGTYTMTLTGNGNFTGTVDKKFSISQIEEIRRAIEAAKIESEKYTYEDVNSGSIDSVNAIVDELEKAIEAANAIPRDKMTEGEIEEVTSYIATMQQIIDHADFDAPVIEDGEFNGDYIYVSENGVWIKKGSEAEYIASIYDFGSGLKSSSLNYEGSKFSVYASGAFKINTEKGTLMENHAIVAFDKIGYKAETSITYGIDGTAPVIVLTEEDGKVVVKVTDSQSGVNKVVYSLDNKVWVEYEDGMDFEADTTVYFKAYDNVGNESTSSIKTSEKEQYISGDTDNDGELEAEDAIYLLRAIMTPEDYPLYQPVDFNGDGKVDTDDAIYLLRHIMAPDDYPLA